MCLLWNGGKVRVSFMAGISQQAYEFEMVLFTICLWYRLGDCIPFTTKTFPSVSSQNPCNGFYTPNIDTVYLPSGRALDNLTLLNSLAANVMVDGFFDCRWVYSMTMALDKMSWWPHAYFGVFWSESEYSDAASCTTVAHNKIHNFWVGVNCVVLGSSMNCSLKLVQTLLGQMGSIKKYALKCLKHTFRPKQGRTQRGFEGAPLPEKLSMLAIAIII